MKRFIPVPFFLLSILFLMQLIPQTSSAAWLQSSPDLEYLGEGGSYTISAGRQFIVKQLGPFVFVNKSGPTYQAAPGERVWAAMVGAPAAVLPGTWLDFGEVPENCTISYSVIDDDVDDRVNVFYVGETAVHEMPQGIVTGGQFKVPQAGKLRLYAGDSIGIWLNKCQVESSPTPPHTPTPSRTSTTEPTVTLTPTGTAGPPVIADITITPTRPEATATMAPTATATKKPRLPACLRINFEVSGGEALEGVYEVHEVGGRLLYSWYAQAGWRDSGWIYGIDISFENVYIEVFYIPQEGPPIKLIIHNPAPGTSYGWLSRGSCHALEVGWPDETITPTPTPDAHDGFNDWFDQQLLDLQRFIWPEIQPTPSSTPASSLRG
jgi:hypothetical protein